MRHDNCGNGVQRIRAATNAQNGCNECECMMNATTGAMDVQSRGVHELCLGAQHVGEVAATVRARQARDLSENGRSSTTQVYWDEWVKNNETTLHIM